MTLRRRHTASERAASDLPHERGRLGRGWRWVREIVHQIHAGEEDMRAVYGDNPNGRPDAERIAAAAALSNLGNMSGGGAGGSF